MIEYIPDKLLKLFFRIIEKDTDLPSFQADVLFQSMDENNPQVFLCEVTNRSKRDHIIKDPQLVKRNQKTKRLIVFFPAQMLIPRSEVLRTKLHKTNFGELIGNSCEVNSVKISAKESKQVLFSRSLDPWTNEYWKNFELKYIPGFVSTNGKVFPAWQPPEFEWEIVFRDEVNFYWGKGTERIPLQVLLEKYRFDEQLKRRVTRRDSIQGSLISSWFRISLCTLSYIVKICLIKLKLREQV